MADFDARRIEHRIRSLEGVLACQITSTSALVLVAPGHDAPAVQARVAAILDDAASTISLAVLAAPSAAGPVPIAGRRRRKAAFALAGSAAALTASVAAAASIVTLAGNDVGGSRPAPRAQQDVAAPLPLGEDPPLAEQLAPAPPRTVTDLLIAAVRDPAVADAAPAVAAEGPTLLNVALPRQLQGLDAARTDIKPLIDARPAPAPSSPVAPIEPVLAPVAARVPAPDLSIASSRDDRSSGPPFGVARRERRGGGGPSDHASPVANAAGHKDRSR